MIRTRAFALAAAALLGGAGTASATTVNQTFCVGSTTKTLSGTSVSFWGYGSSCGMMGSSVSVPGPVIEIGEGDTLNLTLSMGMMTPGESAPYNGHTIHLHGLDVPQSEDGVPDTGASVNGDTYTLTAQPGWSGSYAYHCHVHTVKHLEMGLYGAIIVRPRGPTGAFLNQLTTDAATAYDVAQNLVLGTVDPRWHASTAVGDSTVFASYQPQYFLVQGKQGLSTSAPAVTIATSKGRRVALRLIGMHSVNARFTIKDAGGNLLPFTVYVRDGRALPTPRTVSWVDVSPGQRYDLVFVTPLSGSAAYPQVEYRSLAGSVPFSGGTVYSKITF